MVSLLFVLYSSLCPQITSGCCWEVSLACTGNRPHLLEFHKSTTVMSHISRLRACSHDTDRWYPPVSVSSLPDGWWASVSWHSSVSCSQMLPQQCSDPGLVQQTPLYCSSVGAKRAWSNNVTKWSTTASEKCVQHGKDFPYNCAILLP